MAYFKLFFHWLLLVIAAVSLENKYYCHFYDYQQSVCLRTKKFVGLLSVFVNEVYYWSDQPHEPVYKSREWKIREEGVNRWSFPAGISLPWPVDRNHITFMKVDSKDGEKGYYDVKFTPRSIVRRFKKLEPISSYNMQRAEGVHRGGQLLTFSAGYARPIKVEMKSIQIPSSTHSRNDWYMRAEVDLGWSVVARLRDFTTPNDNWRVLGSLLYEDAEAFIFEFPTTLEPQYGIVFRYRQRTSILYREDQIALRRHNNLPLRLCRERNSPQEHIIRCTDLPPAYEDVVPIDDELPGYDQAIQMLGPPSYAQVEQEILKQ